MERLVHDMGGLPAGDVVREEHDYALWEKRVDAMMMLLGAGKGLMTVDELRRGIEIIGEGAYDRLSYYERWMSSITTNMVQKGYITSEELAEKLAEIDTREAAGEFAAPEAGEP